MIIPTTAKPMVMTAENAASTRKETKTETRRVIPLPEGLEPYHIDEWREIEPGLWEPWGDCGMCNGVKEPKADPIRARHKTGDMVYIAEPYRIHSILNGTGRQVWVIYNDPTKRRVAILSKAEWAKWEARKFPYRRSPGRFMYRSLARTICEVEGVRAERLQEITEEGALAEGVFDLEEYQEAIEHAGVAGISQEGIAVWNFATHIWNPIHAKDGHDWDANPWNFVYRLKKWEGA